MRMTEELLSSMVKAVCGSYKIIYPYQVPSFFSGYVMVRREKVSLKENGIHVPIIPLV
jgi:hypothetical protein